jgi:hypothetical protein
VSPCSFDFARSIVAFDVDESRSWLTISLEFSLKVALRHLAPRAARVSRLHQRHATFNADRSTLRSPAPAACKAALSLQLEGNDELRNGIRLAPFAAEAVSRRLAASEGSYYEVLRQARSQAGASFSCRAESVKRGQEATRQQQQRRRRRAQYAVS